MSLVDSLKALRLTAVELGGYGAKVVTALAPIITEAEAMEARLGDLESAAKEGRFQKKYDALQAQYDGLKRDLAETNAELEKWAERERKEKDDRNIPDDQKKVLRSMNPPRMGAMMTLVEIADKANLSDEAVAVHLTKLKAKGMAESILSGQVERWSRTTYGNEISYSLTLAGDLSEDEKKPSLEGEILLILNTAAATPWRSITEPNLLAALKQNGFLISMQKLELTLTTMSEKGMCDANHETYGEPSMWYISRHGQLILDGLGLL